MLFLYTRIITPILSDRFEGALCGCLRFAFIYKMAATVL